MPFIKVNLSFMKRTGQDQYTDNTCRQCGCERVLLINDVCTRCAEENAFQDLVKANNPGKKLKERYHR